MFYREPFKFITKLLTPLLVLGGFVAQTASASDFGTWYGIFIKSLDTKHFDLVTVSQGRLYNNGSEFLQFFISQRFVYDVNPYLQTGINYTYLPTRLAAEDSFREQHRMELVLTPRWPVSERLNLELRNWLEIRWIEGLEGPRQRSRHRLGFTYRYPDVRWLKAFYANNEFFFDYTIREFSQNRLIPTGITVPVTDRTSLSLYYMLQSLRKTSNWSHAHILGTTINLSF